MYLERKRWRAGGGGDDRKMTLIQRLLYRAEVLFASGDSADQMAQGLLLTLVALERAGETQARVWGTAGGGGSGGGAFPATTDQKGRLTENIAVRQDERGYGGRC